jgi:DNA gyrase subunit A
MITCVSGVTIRTGTAVISAQGRATQGVKLIKLDDQDEIAAITNLNEEQVQSAETEIPEEMKGGNTNSEDQNSANSENENPENAE